MSDMKLPPLPIPDGVGRHGDDLFYTYQMKAYARQCVLADRAARAPSTPMAWMHDSPGRVDVIHDTVKKLLHESHEAAAHLHRSLDKSERYTIPLYAAPGRSARADAWQPIATAPKDETRIILAWGGKSINGFYLDNSATSHPWQGWRTESMVPRPAGKPTHWMPLPQIPETEV